MIRFCDKKTYAIYKGDLDRKQMLLLFFWNESGEHQRDIIVIYDNDDNYYGIVTYSRILMYLQEEEYILRDTVTASENFFEEAAAWFEKNPEELLPILDVQGGLIGFSYQDREYEDELCLDWLSSLEEAEEIALPFSEYQKYCRKICILECNELAYRCYKLFKRLGYAVQVEGEEWGWLGIQSDDVPVLRNEKFYIYAEGAQNSRWDWASGEKPPLVASYFYFIVDWMIEIRKRLLERMTELFEAKGVSVLGCMAPEGEDIEYRTDLELQILFCNLSIEKMVWNKDKVLGKERKLLAEVMGEAEVSQLYDKGLDSEEGGYRKLSYTEVAQEALEDAEGINRIYVMGPCVVEGYGNFIENTFVSLLQKKVGKQYMVVRMPFTNLNWHLWTQKELQKIPLRQKDIVLFFERKGMLKKVNCPKLDLLSLYNDEKRETWMMDSLSLHLNKAGLAVVTEAVYQKILKEEIQRLNKEAAGNAYIQKGEILSEALQEKVREYIEEVRKHRTFSEGSRIGSIVMNCNPFTLGHQYLIEYAASKVDGLYVFVVEEDRSVFPFAARKQMVEEGTAHLDNVCVVPSGSWILSYRTFPVYFGKAKRQEEKADGRMDLEIFARYIAPALGITSRFAGEEPQDKITKQYNEQMADVLGEFGIAFEEVKRKEADGTVISASYVRKCIEEGNFKELEKFVPESTRKYLA